MKRIVPLLRELGKSAATTNWTGTHALELLQPGRSTEFELIRTTLALSSLAPHTTTTLVTRQTTLRNIEDDQLVAR